MSRCKISPRLSHPLLVCVHRALDVKLEVPAYEQSQQMLIHRAERQQYQHQVLSGSLVGGGDASLEGKRAEVTRTSRLQPVFPHGERRRRRRRGVRQRQGQGLFLVLLLLLLFGLPTHE